VILLLELIRFSIGMIFFAIAVILSFIPLPEPSQTSVIVTLFLLLSATIGVIPIRKIGGFVYDVLLYFLIWVLPIIASNPVLALIQDKFMAAIANTMPIIVAFLIIDLALDSLRGFTSEESIFNNLTFDVITVFVKIGLLYIAGKPLFSGV